MTDIIKWRFPSNDHGETKGINDSGVAMFRGTPLKSLAREINQNSLDAAREKPVVVEFDLFYIDSNAIPGAKELIYAFERSLDFWKGMKGGSTRDFFENALRVIKKPQCAVLRISDHHTNGLLGSRERINTDWVNLTKAAGASDKRGTAGGSYGIGKYAPFACSALSTIFYSTYDSTGERACQGVSRLVTFEDENGETTQGTGYYGNEKNTPVYEELKLQPEYARADGDYGTDIYIAGYKYDNGDWQNEIIVSLLDSFLGAIWNDQLVVKVGDVEISKATLPAVIEEYKNSLLDNTADYYETIISQETKWVEHEFPGLGGVKLGVLLGNPEAPRKVSMIRKTGMKIMNKGRVSSVPFTGVLFIEGEELNKRLRAMENPEHTDWQPERVANPHSARALLSSINAFLRDTIQEMVFDGDSQEVDAAGAGAFLPDEDPDAKDKAKEEVVTDKVQGVEKTVKKPPKAKPVPEKPEDKDPDEDGDEDGEGMHKVPGGDIPGGVEDEFHHGGGGGGGEHTHHVEPGGDEPGGAGKTKAKKGITLQKFLPICVDRSRGIYVISVTAAEKSDKCNLELFLSAEKGCYEAPIVDAVIPPAQKVKTAGHVLQELKLEKGKPVRIKVILDYHEMSSMEVKAYEIEE